MNLKGFLVLAVAAIIVAAIIVLNKSSVPSSNPGSAITPPPSQPLNLPQDDDTRIADAYKSFVPKFIAEYRAEWKENPIDIRYDLKKTDSVLNPLNGILSFITAQNQESMSNGVYDEYSVSFSYSDGNWTVIDANSTIHGAPHGDNLSEDWTQLMNRVAANAQK
jgi:hypothetical protein